MKTEIEELNDVVNIELSNIENSKIENEPLEDYGFTNNVDEWLKTIQDKFERYIMDFIFDYEIVKNAKLYSLNPVISYNGKVHETKYKAFDTLKQMREYLKDKKYILDYINQQITSGKYDEKTHKFEALENFKIRYLFRGVILDE